KAYDAFCIVSEYVLTSKVHPEISRKELVRELLKTYRALGCSFTLKLHVLKSHLYLIPEDIDSFSDQMGEQFHQRIKTLEKNFKGKSMNAMMATWCVSAFRVYCLA